MIAAALGALTILSVVSAPSRASCWFHGGGPTVGERYADSADMRLFENVFIPNVADEIHRIASLLPSVESRKLNRRIVCGNYIVTLEERSPLVNGDVTCRLGIAKTSVRFFDYSGGFAAVGNIHSQPNESAGIKGVRLIKSTENIGPLDGRKGLRGLFSRVSGASGNSERFLDIHRL